MHENVQEDAALKHRKQTMERLMDGIRKSKKITDDFRDKLLEFMDDAGYSLEDAQALIVAIEMPNFGTIAAQKAFVEMRSKPYCNHCKQHVNTASVFVF